MLKKMTLFFGLVIFLVWGWARAQTEHRPPFPITQFTLDNGLQVILSEDYSLPLVSVVITYKVGAINEEAGKTGLAYLLENLMFQGSENIGRMQHISFIRRIGGTLNAATMEDKTIFYQTVPSNQLALVLWLESDRMKSLEINASNIQRTKIDLIEEIRHRKTTDPYLESSLLFDQYLFPDFAHSHPIFGQEEDLRELTVAEVKNFYSKFYCPNNAVLAICGHIDKRKTIELVRKYFGTIPKGEKVTPLPPVQLPEKEAIDRTYRDPIATLPAFYLGYRIAPAKSPDFYPLKIAEYILLRGKTSRLHQRLIKKGIAFRLEGGIEEKKGLAGFKVFVVSTNEIMKERSTKEVLTEITRLKTGLISEKEFGKAKNLFRIDYVHQYASCADRAIFLAENQLAQNALEKLGEELDKYLSVSTLQIASVMNKYFTPGRIFLDVKVR